MYSAVRLGLIRRGGDVSTSARGLEQEPHRIFGRGCHFECHFIGAGCMPRQYAAGHGRAPNRLTGWSGSTWQKAAERGRKRKRLSAVSLLRTHLPIASILCHLLPSSAILCRHLRFWLRGRWLRNLRVSASSPYATGRQHFIFEFRSSLRLNRTLLRPDERTDELGRLWS